MAEIKRRKDMKRKLLGLATLLAALVLTGGLASREAAAPVYADSETSEPVGDSSEEESISSEEPASSEEQPQEKEGEKISEKLVAFRDTYLVPLVTGVSLTSVLSTVFSIAMAINAYKNKKTIIEENNKTRKQCLEMLVMAKQVVETANALTLSIMDDKKVSEETKQAFMKQTKMINDSIDKLTQETEKVLQIKPCVIMLIQLMTDLAKVNPQAVSSGVLETIEQLNQQAKKML